MLGTQNVLGTPREPFSHLLNEVICYEIFIVQTRMGWREKNVQFIIFVFERMNPLPTYLSIKGKGSKRRSSAKRFPKISEFVLKQEH